MFILGLLREINGSAYVGGHIIMQLIRNELAK